MTESTDPLDSPLLARFSHQLSPRKAVGLSDGGPVLLGFEPEEARRSAATDRGLPTKQMQAGQEDTVLQLEVGENSGLVFD